MILGNQTWQAGLAAQAKQPLYILEIPAFGIYLSTFPAIQNGTPVLAIPQLTGYGVTVYGVGGYGT